jgi:nitroreductase
MISLTNPALHTRYAVKQFDTTAILTQIEIEVIEESLRLAPSSYGLQAWRFVRVNNPETRAALKTISWNQSQITDSSVLYALCTFSNPIEQREEIVDDYINDVAQTRGVEIETLAGYKNMMLGAIMNGNTTGNPETTPAWLDRQLYIALGFAMTNAANIGVDTCALEGFDPEKANEILNLKELGLGVKCFLAVGKRRAEDNAATAKKVRYNVEKVFINR